MTLKRIVNPEVSMIGGVAAGIAYQLGIPSWIIRGVFIILLLLFSYITATLYILAWVFLPKLFVTELQFEVQTQIQPKEVGIVNEQVEKEIEKKDHIGSNFDDFLDEEGIRKEVEDAAIKRLNAQKELSDDSKI